MQGQRGHRQGENNNMESNSHTEKRAKCVIIQVIFSQEQQEANVLDVR